VTEPPVIAERQHAGLRFEIAVVGALLALVNAPLLVLAWQDQSWEAFGIALFVNPAANGIVALLLLAVTPLAPRLFGVSKRMHVLTALCGPFAVATATLLAIFSMGLHGC
jgi:hypothetical protein